MKEKIKQYFLDNREQMIEDVKRLVRIPSDRGESKEGMPFGEGPRKVLDEAMALVSERGFEAHDVDHYVMTADLGPAEPGLDILAHLDVVPVANNWTVCDPFDPVVLDGKIYGRGTADDKGPAIAALWAMKCVKELGLPLKQRCRLILGSDEECGSSDVRYYYSKNPEAPMTITPDADFPVINVEKGMFHGTVHAPLTGDSGIVSITAGFKANVVPDTAEAVIEGEHAAEFKPYLAFAARETDATFTLSELDGQTRILCVGTGAHAASPETGNNALTALLMAVGNLPIRGKDADTVRNLNWLFPHGDYNGMALGVAQEDEVSGELTLSLNLCATKENELMLQFDCRCPVCATRENLVEAAMESAASVGITIDDSFLMPPHHVPGDGAFVQTLLRCYEEWTGKPGECIAIGGGTYVHMLERGVAFGAAMPDVDNRMHGADEFMNIDDLLMTGMIYAQAIVELCC